jgi:hypothetical protein
MKVKAETVMQFAIVAKAIRQGDLKGSEVVDAILSEVVDRNVDGTKEELDIIKEILKDVDAGFIANLIDKFLKRFGPKDTE